MIEIGKKRNGFLQFVINHKIKITIQKKKLLSERENKMEKFKLFYKNTKIKEVLMLLTGQTIC